MDVIKYRHILPILILSSTTLWISCADRIEENLEFCDNSLSSVPAKVIDKNPLEEDPDIQPTSDLSSLGIEVKLTDLDNSCLLKNKAIQIVKDDFYPNTIAKTYLNLRTNPENPLFQQVSSYYYANKLYRMAIDAGASLNGIQKLSIDAHCNNCNNAYFNSGTNLICLGWARLFTKPCSTPLETSESVLWAADDSDIVLHEFGHAINNNLASHATFSGNTEARALDEAIADYWAMTSNDSPAFSEWFLGFISSYQRNGELGKHIYPADMVAQEHRDGQVFMETLWAIRSEFGKKIADALVIRMIQLLPNSARYKDAANKLLASSDSIDMDKEDKDTLNGFLETKGLLRKDSAQGLTLSSKSGHSSYYIIDDHAFSFTSNGNCDGDLDVRETALLLPNLALSAASIGMGKAKLILNGATGITIASGGSIGYYLRLGGSKEQDFVDVLNSVDNFFNRHTLSYRRSITDKAIIQAGFLVTATSAGTKNMKIQFTPMNGETVEVPISVEVGTSTPSSKRECPNGNTRKDTLWKIW